MFSPSRTSWSLTHLICIDQAPDQVPMFSDGEESELEDEFALDEVSSDVEVDPADMVGIPSDEDDDDDEDAGLVSRLFTAPIRVDCITGVGVSRKSSPRKRQK